MKTRLSPHALLILLALAVGQAGAADEVYKWRDSNGRMQYGNQPPAGVKAEKVMTTISTVPAYKPKAITPIKMPDEETHAAKSAMPTEITSETRKQMLEACEKAGGSDCPVVVNAALRAAVDQAAKANKDATSGSSSASDDSAASTPAPTPSRSRSGAY